MKTLTALFFSTKYWTDPSQMEQAITALSRKLEGDPVVPVIDGNLEEAVKYADCDVLLAVPASGSVQPYVIELSRHFDKVILFAAYVPGNFPLELTDSMLCKNAAPTLMDSYGVLKREKDKTVALCQNFEQLAHYRHILEACSKVQNGKITVIGAPEPWVISVSRDYAVYEKQLGIRIETASQDELIRLYEDTSAEEALDIYRYFRADACEIVEPSEDDIMHCSRMAKAMLKLIEKHQCSGIAIACFDLIGKTKITINFAHCTAPLRVAGKKQKFLLRNHHETGVGASPRVFYDTGLQMSLFRYSGVLNGMTVHTGESIEGRYEPICRTQMRIALKDYEHYMATALGCHQVMTFEDITEDMKELCRLLKINIL